MAERTRPTVAALAMLVVAGLLGSAAMTGVILGSEKRGITMTMPDGAKVAARPGHVGVTEGGLKYAPAAGREFRNVECVPTPDKVPVEAPAAHSWSIPDLHVSVPLVVSAPDAQGEILLPDAPAGIIDAQGSQPGGKEGMILTAGHVDHADGRLSPWGMLHRVTECMHIHLADRTGKTHRFAVTDLYTVPQDSLPGEDLFRTTGPLTLALVTCSGPSIGSTGGPFAFNYRYNLIIKAKPIL